MNTLQRSGMLFFPRREKRKPLGSNNDAHQRAVRLREKEKSGKMEKLIREASCEELMMLGVGEIWGRQNLKKKKKKIQTESLLEKKSQHLKNGLKKKKKKEKKKKKKKQGQNTTRKPKKYAEK